MEGASPMSEDFTNPIQQMTDSEFVEAFESCRLPSESFHHRGHLRLAWIYLERCGPGQAAERISELIRRYAAFHGQLGKYHMTVTAAWLRLLQHAVACAPTAASFEELLAASPELLDKNTLLRYYSPETLQSEAARI